MTRRRALAIAAVIGALAPSPLAQAPALRFHHVHLRVADPAVAMAKYTRANGCTSVVLQGIGVGVRCGQAYVLFDRNDQPAASPVARGAVTVSGKGDRAVIRVRVAATGDVEVARAWFPERLGLDVSRSLTFVSASTASSRDLPDEITHVAFASADIAPALAQLLSTPLLMLGRSDDAIVFGGPGGIPIELVRDAGLGPDAYWCPMHPDVRSPVGGMCPRCLMALVPIPPPVFGDYRMHVDRSSLGPARDRLTIRLTEPTAAQRTPHLLTVHERLLHVFLVSRDLQSFQHVHPDEMTDGTFALDVAWPAPGMYTLFADFYPAGGTPQLLQTSLATADYRGAAFPAAPVLQPDGATKTEGGLRVTLAGAALVAARELTLTFTVADAASGDPVTDLEPYLGAPGHLFVASADLVDAVHSHPSNLRALGPTVSFAVTFSRPGLHRLWVQFQRRGTVITVPFVVEVGRT